MVVGLLPVQVFAAEKPTSVGRKNIFLAIYESGTELPGEPATQTDAGGYTNFDSSFRKTTYWMYYGYYKNNASQVISPDVLDVMTAGSDGTWGYVNTSNGGVENYIIDDAIAANEEAMIKVVKGNGVDASQYDILWYVIKKQDSDDAWHIDGVIVDTAKY